MKPLVVSLAIFHASGLPACALAAEADGYISVAALLSFNDTSAADELDNTGTLALRGGIAVAPRLSVEFNLRDTAQAKQSGTDSRSAWSIGFESLDVGIGAACALFEPAGGDGASVHLRAGLLRSRSEIIAKEHYFGVKPDTTMSATHDTTGYYTELSLEFRSAGSPWYQDIRAGMLKRPDVLQTINGPIDVKESWLGAGIGRRF